MPPSSKPLIRASLILAVLAGSSGAWAQGILSPADGELRAEVVRLQEQFKSLADLQVAETQRRLVSGEGTRTQVTQAETMRAQARSSSAALEQMLTTYEAMREQHRLAQVTREELDAAERALIRSLMNWRPEAFSVKLTQP